MSLKSFYKKFLVLTAGVTLSYSSSIFADDHCLNMSGTWNGNGKVKVLFFTCEYDVVANVADGNPANATVAVTKRSGSFVCPSQTTENVVISCKDNWVEIKSERINVSGQGSSDGMSVFMSGSITAVGKNHPLNLELYKQKYFYNTK